MSKKIESEVNEWKKKCCDSSLSKEPLIPIISSSFNVMGTLLQEFDANLIQRALGSLEFERNQSMAIDTITELRSIIYGHFECLHKTVLHLIERKNQSRSSEEICTKTKEILGIVDEWKRKCCDSSLPYFIIPVISRSFDVMSAILKDSDHIIVQRTLVSLDFERTQSLDFEKVKEPSFRSLLYGLFECLYKTFDHLIEERNQLIYSEKGWTQPNEIPSQIHLDSLVSQLNSSSLFSSSVDHLTFKEQTIENEFIRDDMEFNEEIPEERENRFDSTNDLMENEGGKVKDSSEQIPKELLGILSRRVPKASTYNKSSKDSGGDDVQFVKKKKEKPVRFDVDAFDDSPCETSDSGDDGPAMETHSDGNETGNPSDVMKVVGQAFAGSTRKGIRLTKRNDTELECIECEFRTRSTNSWMVHLRYKHATTPTLAGLALLCDCGNESFSDTHSRKSNCTNSIVIRKNQGPIRRLNEKNATPQCVLCDRYPTTVQGYTRHLARSHDSSLKENGIYLKCACEVEFRAQNNHNEECEKKEFTLHKLEEEENEESEATHSTDNDGQEDLDCTDDDGEGVE